MRHRGSLALRLFSGAVVLAGVAGLAWWFRQEANRPVAEAWAAQTDLID